jgi:hypothetical protein
MRPFSTVEAIGRNGRPASVISTPGTPLISAGWAVVCGRVPKLTRLADRPGSVTDDIWAEAARHYTERQLSSLVLMVSITNFFNRINTTFRVSAGTRWD